MATPKKMSEGGLNAYLDNELRHTIGFGEQSDEIAAERKLNLEMYLNRPVGDEEEGRSQVQDSTVQDVIEGLLPNTLAPFISSDTVFDIEAVGDEDEAYVDIASRYLNHIIMKDNNGVKLQYTWQKDALLQKNGFVAVSWRERQCTRRISQRVDYYGLTQLSEDPEIEVLEYVALDNGQPVAEEALATRFQAEGDALEGVVFDVEYRRSYTEGRVAIDNIAPENVIVSNDASDLQSARLRGWCERVTISQLREEGYEEDDIKTLLDDDSEPYDYDGEEYARRQAQGVDEKESTEDASRCVWRSVLWVNVDYDGDGKAELRRIVRAGNRQNKGGKILANEEADEVLMVDFTPIIMPHQLFGRCPADQAREIQRSKTFTMRMVNDVIAHTAHPRQKVREEASDNTWDDLSNDIPGAPIRVENMDDVQPFFDPADLGGMFQQLEYYDRLREVRTPVTRQDQGVQVDVLHEKSAREASIQASATAIKKELILRLYANALSRLGRMINRLTIKHQDQPRILRLFPDRPAVKVDPRYWNADMDISVNVGLGMGTQEQMLQALMMVLREQKEAMASGTGLADAEKIYNTLARLIEFSGLSSAQLYFNDPNANAPQEITPQMLKAETQKAFQAGVKQAQDQTKMAEIKSDEMLKMRELDIDERSEQMEHSRHMAELQERQKENVLQAAGYRV